MPPLGSAGHDQMDPAAYRLVHGLEAKHWFFVGRRRIIASLLSGLPRGRILDIGCGTGSTLQVLEGFGVAIGVDCSAQAVGFARGRGAFRLCQAFANRLPFADGSVDLVAALDLVEHLEDDCSAMLEFRRVLKVGGCLLLSAPAFGLLWSDFDRLSGHYRRYSRQGLRELVEGAGFAIGRLSYFDTVLFPAIWAIRSVRNALGRWLRFRSDLELSPMPLNGVLAALFGSEAILLRLQDLPFGASLVCVARKT